MSFCGRKPCEPRRPLFASTARIAAQTCLQISPRSENGQEQEARRTWASRQRKTSYSVEPVTIASARSGLQAVRRTVFPRK